MPLHHVFRIACFSLLLVWPGVALSSALSEPDEAVYKAAFNAAFTGQWHAARKATQDAENKLLAKALEWVVLTDDRTEPSFEQLSTFMTDNPAWPRQLVLRRKAEKALPVDTPADQVIAWFRQHPPQTALGATRYVQALRELGQENDARTAAQAFWMTGTLGWVEEKDFLKAASDLLSHDDMVARMSQLLWADQVGQAERLLPHLKAEAQSILRARVTFQHAGSKAEQLFDKLSPAARKDSGVVFDRVRWLRRKQKDETAAELLLKTPSAGAFADKWWPERQIIARRLMEQGDWAKAYKIVKEHGQTAGPGVAEAEFLSGWLALRKTNAPAKALDHFDTLYHRVTTPISLARGAYWIGRAHEQLGDANAAKDWYRKAAAHGLTFYGQAAALKLDPVATLDMPEPYTPSGAQTERFNQDEFVQTARLLNRVENALNMVPADRWSSVFLRHLGRADTPAPFLVLASQLSLELNRPDIAVALGKLASVQGLYALDAAYPLLDQESKDALHQGPEPALVHAIIRQESTFNPAAISAVGARGLMQLMPATARQVAKRIGVPHSTGRLTEDISYNVRLGSTYLKQMVDNFDGSYVEAVAAYNAGPHRVKTWAEDRGRPGPSLEETIDWIEQIPFDETRNYVMRVLEGAQVYRARLNDNPPPLALTAPSPGA